MIIFCFFSGKTDGNQVTQAESKQLVSCLLSLIDGVDTNNNTHSSGSSSGSGSRDGGRGGVFIIATSSKPNNIDPAMRRPGMLRCCGTVHSLSDQFHRNK